MAKLSKQQREEARQAFDDQGQCPDCGGLHSRACPRVKRMVLRYSETRGLQQRELIGREVEYFNHGDWPEEDVIWPEDCFEDDELESTSLRTGLR